MNKKYFPLVALLAAIILFVWIKKNQRGGSAFDKDRSEQRRSVPGFDRNSRAIIYSKHARCRMDCRMIDESEVLEILQEGKINEDKIESSAKGVSYPLEGRTHDGQHVRIVFAPKEDGKMVVVTVIDLDREWVCDCG